MGTVLVIGIGAALRVGGFTSIKYQPPQSGGYTFNDATAKVNELSDSQYTQYVSTGETSSSTILNEMASAYEHAAVGKGTQAKVAALMGKYTRTVEKASQPLQNSIDRVREAGRVDPATFSSPAVLEERIRLFEGMNQQTLKFLTFYEECPRLMDEMARKLGFSENDRRSISAYQMQGLRLKQHREYRTSLSQFARDAAEYLRFLHGCWGQWRFDEPSQSILLEHAPEEVASDHKRLVNAVAAADVKLTGLETAWIEGAKQFRERQKAQSSPQSAVDGGRGR